MVGSGIDIGIVEANNWYGLCFSVLLSEHAYAKVRCQSGDASN
jgi:hypothetical protein